MPRGTPDGMASWWRNLFGLKERAALPSGTALTDGILGPSLSLRSPPRRGTRELMVAYREMPWLRSVAGRIARGVASCEWSVFVRAEEATSQKSGKRKRSSPTGRFLDVAAVPSFRWGRDRSVRDIRLSSGTAQQRAARRRELAAEGLLREVPDHPILELLANPNSELTGRSSMQMTQTWTDLKGEAFWVLNSAKSPTNFLPIPPHWVASIPSSDDPNFRLSFQALQMLVPRDRMVWFRDPDPENPYGRGTGVAEALGDELETDEYAAKYVKSWFYNGGLPSAIVAFEGLQVDGIKRVEEKWNQQFTGPAQANRVHFGAGKMNAQKLDTSFKEQQLNEVRRFERDTVAQVFGVPPEIVGIIENSNRSTIDAATYIYALGVEYPRVEFNRSELQAKLVPAFDSDICLECEVSIPDDEARRLSVMTAQPTVFSKNEWRAEARYDPLPEFDGQFPEGMPGQAAPAAPADGAKDEPKPAEPEPEDDSTDGEAKSIVPADPPWARSQ